MPIRSTNPGVSDNGGHEPPIDKNRLLGGGFDPEDDSGEYSLRPKRLAEYIGQRKIKENLGIAMAAGEAARRVPGPSASPRPTRPWENEPCECHLE